MPLKHPKPTTPQALRISNATWGKLKQAAAQASEGAVKRVSAQDYARWILDQWAKEQK